MQFISLLDHLDVAALGLNSINLESFVGNIFRLKSLQFLKFCEKVRLMWFLNNIFFQNCKPKIPHLKDFVNPRLKRRKQIFNSFGFTFAYSKRCKWIVSSITLFKFNFDFPIAGLEIVSVINNAILVLTVLAYI